LPTPRWAPKSLLARRVLRIAGSFAIVVAVYWAYALVAVPLIEPSADARRQSLDACPEGMGNAIKERIEALRPLFRPGSWELGDPKILESDQVKLLIQDYENLDNGVMKITRCTIILTPSQGDASEEQQIRQAIILEAPEGAELKFDKGLNLRRMEVGRLVSGDLKGQITIRNQGALAGSQEGLWIVTRDVHLTENEISTPHPVDFRWGTSFGQGRQMHMKLARGDQAENGSRGGMNIAGIESFRLEHIERLHLELGKVKLPGGTGGSSGGTGGLPASAAMESATTHTGGQAASAAPDMPVEIACDGPFVFDVLKRVATFQGGQQGVDVWRIHPKGPSDQLHSESLSIFFTERRDASAARKAPEGTAADKQPTGSLDLVPERIEADGNPVVLTAPSQRVYARGQSLKYDLLRSRIVLDDSREILLQQGPNEIRARSLMYQSAGPGRVGQVEAVGPGWLRGQMSDRPGQQLEARWKDQLRVRPHGQNQLISLTGGADLKFAGFGRMDAREIYFWLLEAPEQGKADQTRLQPDRMLARDDVHVDSRQLSGAVQRLEIWFEQSGAGGGKWQADQRVAPLEPTAYRQSPQPPSAAGMQLSVAGATVELSPQHVGELSPKKKEEPTWQAHFEIAGRLLRARVLMLEAQKTELAELLVEDGVRLRETQTKRPDERPLLVTGENLHVVDAGKPHAAVTVLGQPAHFEGRGLSLNGSNINLNRGTNRLWIDGPGRMELPLVRDLQNRPMPKGSVLKVDWQERMVFDGRTARFEESVKGTTPTQNLRTETLEVQLQQAIDFADATERQDPQLEQILCRGGVFMENRSSDAQGQLSQEQMQTADLAVNFNPNNGALTAGGPGWFTSVRRAGEDPLFGGRMGPGASARNAAENAPDDRAAPAPGRADGQLNGLHVRFQGSITGDVHKRTLTFHDRVRTAFAPVDTWLAKLDPYDPEALRPPSAVLHCDRLSVNEMPTSPGKRGTIELEAVGNAIVEGIGLNRETRIPYTARGIRITYAEAKDLLVLEGDGRTDATLFYQEQVGAATSKHAARKILYWPKTHKCWIEGARSLELSQFPLGNPGKPPAAGNGRWSVGNRQ